MNYNECLHYPPLCSQIFTGIHTVEIDLCRDTSSTAWHGKVIRFFLHSTLVATYAVNIVFSFVEGSISFAFSALILLPYIVSRARSDLLRKHMVRSLGHSINSFMLGGIQCAGILYYLSKRKFVTFHILVSFINESTYLSSACIAEWLLAISWNRLPQRFGIVRIDVDQHVQQVFLGALYHSLLAMIKSFISDFGFIIQNARIGVYRQFLDQYPQHRQTFEQLSFERFRNINTRPQILSALRDFSSYLGFTRPTIRGGDPLEVHINNNGTNDTLYQNRLIKIVKDSFIEIYQSDKFSAFLSSNPDQQKAVEEGKMDLSCFSASIYLPLAHYAQLKELDGEIVCPESFNNREWIIYNTRQQRLLDLKRLLSGLSEEERNVLIEKLMRMSSFKISDKIASEESQKKVQALFIGISDLAGSLHQGKLMSEYLLNFGNFANPAHGRNLFQGACQDAYNEINA